MMVPQMGQVGPPMHPSMMQPQQQQQQQQPPPSQQPSQMNQFELKFDSVGKVKALTWSLKESFSNVMKVANARVNHMAAGKTIEDTPPRFDKTLEDFFSICNQIELNLKAIQECSLQQKDSMQYLPLHVCLGKPEGPNGPLPEGTYLTYPQYISTIKGQVNFAKSAQEMLSDGARKITQAD